ncbi:ribosomal protein S18-alanine N-acetyltransferase [Leptolyngbya sp. FACHB-17]|uniref:ribosomal protein S18-alanine N-acetyltransferase n=1 Tax=Leptolyngbya sp. AS-A5 TaxID=2933919 RepID=UPI0016816225|nr:ribosomal protein S18-alanine N-acetyltransferase [Leptolyngbya sp. FACHB-17]MBD2079098.1 ribosomal protein S18-alanine N-acetyltransferase [Leptolyngbya sp. FACHB-17]
MFQSNKIKLRYNQNRSVTCNIVNRITLQTIAPSLLPQVLELDRICFGGLWTLEGYQREIDSPNSELIAITSGDRLIGYGCFWAIVDEAHITIIAVHPDHQQQGLGKLLLFALLDRARQRQMKHATLEVRISNQSAISLYEKFQFKVAGQRKDYYTDTGENALILWRGGLQAAEFQSLLKEKWLKIRDRLTQCDHILIDPESLLSLEKTSLTKP